MKVAKVKLLPKGVKEEKSFETEEEALSHMREGKEQWDLQLLFDEEGKIVGRMTKNGRNFEADGTAEEA